MTLELKLSSVLAFRFLLSEDLAVLAPLAQVIEKSEGDVIIVADDPVPGIFIIGQGSAGVFTTDSNKPLLPLESGESIGEMSFLENMPASATIRAMENNTKLALFPRADLEQAMSTTPGLGQRLYRGIAVTLSQKLRRTNNRVTEEIEKGRILLQTLGYGTSSDSTSSFRNEVEQYTEDLRDTLTVCQDTIDNLSQEIPEKKGVLSELGTRLSNARSKHDELMPSIVANSEMVADYLDNVAKFLDSSEY